MSTRNALIVAGGWDGHEPKKCATLWESVLTGEGFNVEIATDLAVYEDAAKLAGLSLIVPIWTMGQISKEQTQGLQAAVRSGVGLAGFHGGMCDAFRSDLGYQWMTGGQFLGHPDNIKDYTVNITSDDPIVAGLSDFQMHSEQYYMFVDPGVTVLAHTTFVGLKQNPWVEGTVMPVVWKRQWDQGRIFFSSLGHVAADFSVPEAKEIQKRGMLWAAR